MIWIGLLALSLAALMPLFIVLLWHGPARGRRDAALALHTAQLIELDRERAEHRIGEAEYAGAKLEVQRRLLAAADSADPPTARGQVFPLIAALTLVPAAGLALYLVGGSPGMPAMPHRQVLALRQAEMQSDDALIQQLRARLRLMNPSDPRVRQGYLLLGNAEAQRRNMAGAAEAWGLALKVQYDPTLAAETAEALTEAAGAVTLEAERLFRGALEAAPSDAPWRPMAEKRLSQAK